MPHRVRPLFLVAVLLAAAVLPLAGCRSASDKLEDILISLIEAEERGEAEAFAQSRGLELADGSVRVTITPTPGQLEAAADAISRVGTVKVKGRTTGLIGAVVPITSLTTLAKERSILRIGRPLEVDY